MVDIRNYFKSTMRLVSSLTIKIDEISKHFNYQYYIKNGLEIPTPYEDKYFLNLCGIRSKIDPKVFIHDNITGEDIEITVSNLDKNLWLRKELNEFDSLFNMLCKENPGMSTYIRGCINPIDLDTLLNTPTNSIIYYNKKYIAENELYLINEIESFVNTYMATYHNPQYLLDELYLPTLLFSLYQSITMFIITKRLENILTNKADLFHIENHLSSYKDIYQILDIYNKETEIYLYGNIRRLKTNIGKNSTINELLKKVYDKNRYGVGTLNFNRLVPKMINDAVVDYKKEFFENEYKFIVDKANKSLYNINGNEYGISSVMKLEDNVNLVNDNELFDTNFNIIERYDKHFLKTELSLSKTKVYMLDKPERISTHYNNIFISTFSNLIDYLEKPQAFFYTDYINPVDNKLYKLSNVDIRNILLFNLLQQYRFSDTDNITITLSGIIKQNINKDIILNQTWHKQNNAKILDYIIGDNTNMDIRGGELESYFNYTYGVEKRIWYLISNVNDLMIKNDIRVMSKFLIDSKSITTNVNELYKVINNEGLESFCKNDFLLNNTLLMEHLTKLDLRPTKSVIDRFKKLVTFFNKTTSYTIQLIYDVEFKDVFLTNTTKNNLNLGYKSLIEIKAVEWYKYEQVDYLIKSANMETDLLDVKDQQVNMSYKLSKHGLLPCVSIMDELSNLLMVMGGKYIRSRFYRSTQPYTSGYEDERLENIYSINSSLPKQNVVKPFETKFLDNTTLLPLDNWLSVTSLPPEYFVNYTTRQGNIDYIIDNRDIDINKKDMKLLLKSNNDLNNIVTTLTDEFYIPSIETMVKSYNKFISTTSSLVTHVINDDIKYSNDIIQDVNIKAISMLSTKTITDVIDDNKMYLLTLATERVKKLTRIIEDIKTLHVANQDLINSSIPDKLDYGVKGIGGNSVSTIVNSITNITPTYTVSNYFNMYNPLSGIKLTSVGSDSIDYLKGLDNLHTNITKYSGNETNSFINDINIFNYLPYTIRPMNPEKTSLIDNIISDYLFNYDQMEISDIRDSLFYVKPLLDTELTASNINEIHTPILNYNLNKYPRKFKLTTIGSNLINDGNVVFLNSGNGRIFNTKRKQTSIYRKHMFDHEVLDSSPGLLLQYGTKIVTTSEYGLDKVIRHYEYSESLNVNMFKRNNTVMIDNILNNPILSSSKCLLPFTTESILNSNRVLLDKSYIRPLDNSKDVSLSKKKLIDNRVFDIENDINSLTILPYTINFGKQDRTSLIKKISGDIVVKDMVSINDSGVDIINNKVMVDASVYSKVENVNESLQTYILPNYQKFMSTNNIKSDNVNGSESLLSLDNMSIVRQLETTKENRLSLLTSYLSTPQLTPVAQYLGKQDKTSLISDISNSATPLDTLHINNKGKSILDVAKHMITTNIKTVTEEVDKLNLISSIKKYGKFFNPVKHMGLNTLSGDKEIYKSDIISPTIRKKELVKMLAMIEDFEETTLLTSSGELLPYTTVSGGDNISISGTNRINVLKNTETTVLDLLSTSASNRQQVYSTTSEFITNKILSSSKYLDNMGSTDVDTAVVVNDNLIDERDDVNNVMLDTSKRLRTSLYNTYEDEFNNNEVITSPVNLLHYGSLLSTNKTLVVYDKLMKTFAVKEIVNMSIKTRNNIVTAKEDVNMSPTLHSSLYGNIPYGNEITMGGSETIDLDNDIGKFSNYVVPFNIKSNTGFKTFSLEEDIFSNKTILFNDVRHIYKTSLINIESNGYIIDNSQMMVSSHELDFGTINPKDKAVTSYRDELVTVKPSYSRIGYFYNYKIGDIVNTSVNDSSMSVVNESVYVRIKTLSNLSVKSVYDMVNTTSVVAAIENKYYKELASAIDRVATEYIVDNKDLFYGDSHYGYNIKSNEKFPVYTGIEDLNRLNYSYAIDSYMYKEKTNKVSTVSDNDSDMSVVNESLYVRIKTLSNLSVKSVYDIPNTTSVVTAIGNKRYKDLASTIDGVVTEYIVNNKDLFYKDNYSGYSIKGNREFPVYTGIEDLNRLNYSYIVDSYMYKEKTNKVDKVPTVSDDEVSMEVEVITKNKSYAPTIVETDVEDIEMDITFEIKTK